MPGATHDWDDAQGCPVWETVMDLHSCSVAIDYIAYSTVTAKLKRDMALRGHRHLPGTYRLGHRCGQTTRTAPQA